MLRDKLLNMTRIQDSRYQKAIKFLFTLVLGVIAYIFIAIYITPNGSTETPYRTSWIGNTFGGGSKWVQLQISSIYVASDGTVYTNSEWDEAGREAGIYKNGDVIGMAKDVHGWGRHGGVAVTANSKYIYVAMQQDPEGKPGEDYPASGTKWYCVRRYNLSGETAPFEKGRGWDKSMLIVSNASKVTGLATAGDELYVSDAGENRIRVYNTETMNELRSWSATRPQQIAVERDGNLWVILSKDNSNAPKILHYSKTGKLLPEKITDIGEASAIAIDNQGRLLVADNGPRQQVLIYNIAEKPTLVSTFGTEKGIYSGTPGEVGEKKLYGITGVGTDTAGNIYVSNDGFNKSGADLRKFSPEGRMQWQLLGLQFLDSADADPSTDGVDIFTKDEHFVMDYSKANGREGSYKGYTLDKFRYPDDGRLHTTPTAPFVRRLQGKRILFLSSEMMSERLLVYRFDNVIAVPCGIFAKGNSDWPDSQPKSASWLWRDLNGNGSIQSNEYEKLGEADDSIWGWEVDEVGDVWQTSETKGILHYRNQGLDATGCPIYTATASEKIPIPAPFNKLLRIKYFPKTDVMYLGGYTVDRPQTGEEWGIVGTEIIRYDNWSKSKKVRFRILLPYNPTANPMLIIKAMDVAGERVFAVDSRKAEVYVYDATTGAELTKLKPGSEVANESGWIDIPYALRAFKRANGEYVVFVEEDAKAKVIVYRLGS